MFFSMFNHILYDNQYLTDLSATLTAIEVDDPKFLYDTYVIQDGERPDSISNKFYGVPYYHWVILVTNGLTLQSWPKSDKVLMKHWERKYGGVPSGVHHQEDANGLIVSDKFPALIEVEGESLNYYFNGDGLGVISENVVHNLGNPVSIYDHEIAENDLKKNIRILDKRHLADITNLAKGLLVSR